MNALWSFATVRYYPAKFLEAMVGEMERRMNMAPKDTAVFNTQELSNGLWAFAK